MISYHSVGASWTAPVTINTGNMDYYTVVVEQQSQTIIVMLQKGSSTVLFTSTDDGSSWSDAKEITFPSTPFGGPAKPAVGHGLQLDATLCSPTCADAGRLIMPFVCQDKTTYACMYYSDDRGASWSFGGVAQAGSRESQVRLIPVCLSLLTDMYLSHTLTWICIHM